MSVFCRWLVFPWRSFYPPCWELADLEGLTPPSAIEAMRTWLGLELVERLGTDLETIATRKRKELMEDGDQH